MFKVRIVWGLIIFCVGYSLPSSDKANNDDNNFNSGSISKYFWGTWVRMDGSNEEWYFSDSQVKIGSTVYNARMESFFATLKKEKLYQINTAKMKMEEVKTIVWRYVMVYYNRQRISTVNEGGLPPTIYRNMATTGRSAA